MPENFYFGGGAGQSAMHPVVLAVTVLAVIAVLIIRRNVYLLVPIVYGAFLTPFGAQLFIGGLHFFVIRIVASAALCRLLVEALLRKEQLLPGGVTRFDKLFFAWALCRGTAFVALNPQAGAIINQGAFWLDTFGLYVMFRYVINNADAIRKCFVILAGVTAILAVCMAYEHATGYNVFNTISARYIIPWTREGSIRAQGAFGHSITAGTFGATLIPVFVWLCVFGKARLTGAVGLSAAVITTVTSVSSTPVSACLAGVLGLILWPLRRYMRHVRWSLVAAVCVLAAVMKAPVWYILGKVDFVGGHGWYRAFLVHQFADRIGEWWLLGTVDNGSWAFGTWDRCNQFVAEAASGGLLTLGLFIAQLVVCFSIAGQARRRAGSHSTGGKLSWALGSALFAHVVAFQGVSYWDQMRVSWILLLAMFPALHLEFRSRTRTSSAAPTPVAKEFAAAKQFRTALP